MSPSCCQRASTSLFFFFPLGFYTFPCWFFLLPTWAGNSPHLNSPSSVSNFTFFFFLDSKDFLTNWQFLLESEPRLCSWAISEIGLGSLYYQHLDLLGEGREGDRENRVCCGHGMFSMCLLFHCSSKLWHQRVVVFHLVYLFLLVWLWNVDFK